MKTVTIILLCIYALCGVVSLLAALCNWDWWYKSSNARLMVGQTSRRTARIIYACIGIAFLMAVVITLYYNK